MKRWLVFAVVGLGAGALGIFGFLQLTWLRADEVPPIAEDIWSRTALEPPVVASEQDFAALQDGAAAAFEVAPELFPLGLAGIDFALYDSRTLYVYAHEAHAGEVQGVWREFTRAATPLWASPTRRSMKACRISEGYANWSRVRAVTHSETFFMCAPLSSFVTPQQGASIYDTRESYLATVVHEFGHQYFALHPDARPASELRSKVDQLPAGANVDDVLDEARATWAELRASRRLFPEHFERLSTEFQTMSCRDSPVDPHCLGLRLALEVIAAERSDSPSP